MGKKSVAVHFTVEADFIHTHARRLWSEGEFNKAMSFLDTMIGITPEQKNRVIMGQAKFKEIGNTQEFVLVKDNWTPDKSRCHFCQYPDPGNEEEMQDARTVLLADKIKKEYSRRLFHLLNKAEGYEKAQRRIREFFMWVDFDRDVLEGDFAQTWDEMEQDVDALVRVANISGFMFGKPADEDYKYASLSPDIMTSPDVDRFMQDTKINYTIDKMAEEGARPKPTQVYENGIITPDGNFYLCGTMGHNTLAVALGYPSDNSSSQFAALEAALADGCVAVSCSLISRTIRKGKGGLNDAQRQRVGEWYKLTEYSKAPFMQYDFDEVVE